MKITNIEAHCFTNVKTTEQFMNILRSFKVNQATETTTINRLEAINGGTHIMVIGMDITIEDTEYGQMLYANDDEQTKIAFPIDTLRIQTQTTTNF